MSKIIGGAPTSTEQQQMQELARLIRSAEDVKCDACGCTNFINIYKIRKISGLMTGTGKDTVIPVPVYACADCGHVNEKFLKSVGLDRDGTNPNARITDEIKPEDINMPGDEDTEEEKLNAGGIDGVEPWGNITGSKGTTKPTFDDSNIPTTPGV